MWNELEAGKLTIMEAGQLIEALLVKDPIYNTWQRVGLSATLAFLVCPLAFSGESSSAAEAVIHSVFAAQDRSPMHAYHQSFLAYLLSWAYITYQTIRDLAMSTSQWSRHIQSLLT